MHAALHRGAVVIAAGAVLVGAGALTDPTPTPACIHSWPEARYRPYGYDHLVHIHNACTVAAECLVTTDVNPEHIPASVPAEGEVEVLTFVGSPARTFTPSVWCQFRARSRGELASREPHAGEHR